MNIYFGVAISGGRQKQATCKELVKHCKERGKVLNQDVFKKNASENEEFDTYSYNMDLIDKADVFVAEVSVPSIGVGMEIEHAINLYSEIPILCIYDETLKAQHGWGLSRMIMKHPKIELVGYTTIENAKTIITEFLDKHTKSAVSKSDNRPTIPGHPNCHYGDCNDCHVVYCEIYQGYKEIPVEPE